MNSTVAPGGECIRGWSYAEQLQEEDEPAKEMRIEKRDGKTGLGTLEARL